MIKYFIYASILLTLFGCSATQADLKAEEEKTLQYLVNLKNCRIFSTKALDDRVSSVEIIAATVIQDCTKEANAVMEKTMLYKDEEFRKNFYKQMMGVQTSGVITMILKHRRETKDETLKVLKF